MKILVIGADGQLGTDLVKIIPPAELIALTIKDIDITDREQTHQVIKKYQPSIVINTAAYHNVDKCEDEVEAAFRVNTYGVKYLAEVCQGLGVALVQLSTDYVFAGDKRSPYLESDVANPQSVYAISKLAGEQCVKYHLKKYFIVRTTGLYGVAGCLGKGGTNFVEGMIKRAAAQAELRVVSDEILSPTYSLDLAEAIYSLVQTNNFGLYHVVNAGQCSWYEFTVKIFELLNKKVSVKAVTAKEFQAKAKRPGYSVLESNKLKNKLRPWQEALKAYLMEKGYL
ncbi:MAG: dTDP-4-dehydrorhamnose reductase [bacterium]